jgi:hypothetical protein
MNELSRKADCGEWHSAPVPSMPQLRCLFRPGRAFGHAFGLSAMGQQMTVPSFLCTPQFGQVGATR